MNFSQYNKLNNLIGWAIFLVASFTYLMTMEWTVSLWDCGEFIPASYKLQICHPPGAPFFILINRVFTFFAFEPKMVPLLVNGSSAISSAFAILFLFWSITALAIKLLVKDEQNIEKSDLIAILGSGIVGALAYTWSDTFWFSAVEGEVYALSSFFTALIFWLGLKWERRASEQYNLRWIVLIFYMVGIVIGVHLLGLLVIPVIILMYYFKKYEVTTKGTIIALGIGIATLGVVQYGIIQYLLRFAAKFDVLFVNSFGLPLWSGVVFFIFVLLGAIGYGIYYTYKQRKVFANLGLLSAAMVIIGYMSYALTPIRSYANTPIDMNDPQDIFSLISYVAREQYGDNYLVSGPYFPAYNSREYYDVEEGAMQYIVAKNEQGKPYYKETGLKVERTFKGKMKTIFPRMYSPQDNHIQGYRYWTGIKQKQMTLPSGETKTIWEDEDPNFTFSFTKHNLKFFFDYQINYMYWRFFAWNFIGRQNDLQGTQNEYHQGNWITGLGFIDEMLLGSYAVKNVPDSFGKNKAHNPLYALPFLLGLLGMYFQYKKGKLDFFVVFLFFFMTGLAIEIYLNMPNPQPRERDYAFVGSFYVFAIWIGLGVLFLYDFLKNKMGSFNASLASSLAALVLVPGIMVSKEWDDHDRSHRYTSRDYGLDYLESCAKNAVLFCNGDNDTYPLWYCQEVEGIRDDIRIINLSLLSTDWYVNQMRRPINNAPALPFTITPEQALGWDYLYYEPQLAAQYDQSKPIPVVNVMKFIGNPANRSMVFTGEPMPYLPTRYMCIVVDKEKVLKNGTVPAKYANLIEDTVKFKLNKNFFLKSDIMVLDFIGTNNFELPVYFSITSGPGEYLNLGSYLQQEGLTYRLVPFKNPSGVDEGQDTRLDTDIMYDNVMKKFKFGGLDEGDKLVDYVTGRQCSNMRGVFSRLARNLAREGKYEKAIAVVDKCMKEVPAPLVPYDFYMVQLVDAYYKAGAPEKAVKLSNDIASALIQELAYYKQAPQQKLFTDIPYEIQRALYGVNNLHRLAKDYNQEALVKKLEPVLGTYNNHFKPLMEQFN